MKKLTKSEKQWLVELQEVFDRCPSTRFEAFTGGSDDMFIIYDKNYQAEINEIIDTTNADQCSAVEELGCKIAEIRTPFDIQSTAW